jgi:hypothetical protein
MRGFLITNLKTKRSRVAETLEVAATLVGADADDIAWTLEDAGLRENDFWSVADIVTDSQPTSSLLRRTVGV